MARDLTVDEVIAREIDAERGRRCVNKGTLATAWFRNDRLRRHRFLRQICNECDRWVDAFVHSRPLMLSVHAPPGSGKSESVGRAMPPRAMALAPGKSIVYVTSMEDRAIEVSLAVRTAVERLAPAFPHLARHPKGPWGTAMWRTAGGGWWTALSPGMKTGGVDAHGIIFDDVTGSESGARSRAEQASLQRFIVGDALTRFRGLGPLMNMETRRGLNDATAFLGEKYGDAFEIKVWPWIANQDCAARPWDGREPGEYLWPEQCGPEWHASIGRYLVPGHPVFEAQYQQRPTREGGAVILEEWCSHRYAADPMAQARACPQIVIAVDPAAKTGDRNDPTGIVVAGIIRGEVYVLHAEAERRAPPDTEQRLADLAAEYRATGRPVTILVEDTSVGQAWIPALKRRGLTVIGVPVAGRGDKVARMHPHLGRWAAGDVRLPASAAWVAAFVAQLVSVPDCEHDDLWDAMSVLLWYLASTALRIQPAGTMRLAGA